MKVLRKLCFCTLSLSGMLFPGVALAHPKPAAVHQVQVITSKNLHWYGQSNAKQATLLVPSLRRWDTRSTDLTASWPDATDPTRTLPIKVQAQFACIRYNESRNHLRSLEIHSFAGGWYQFTPYIWSYARAHLPGLPATPQSASGDQQSLAAVWYYQRNQSLWVEWSADKWRCG